MIVAGMDYYAIAQSQRVPGSIVILPFFVLSPVKSRTPKIFAANKPYPRDIQSVKGGVNRNHWGGPYIYSATSRRYRGVTWSIFAPARTF